ncbi:MAG: hypothetical protein H6745_08195 [Deltaproteobacteria bacterium]|nr:hypothetical protein [Deltaproteobacteria bacterium]
MKARLEDSLLDVALAGFGAVSEALYPESDCGAPSHRDADMVARARSWFLTLPPESRRLLLALFASMELLGAGFAPALGRFSRLSAARRLRVVERLRASPIAPLKFLGDALKQSTSMIYLSHPAVLAHLGVYKSCDHPGAGLVPVRADALRSAPGATS